MDSTTVHERRWWALAVLGLSLVVITIDHTILNVAIPALTEDTGASTSQLQWIIDGYTLVFAGLLLTTGAIGDRFGRKGALQLGLITFCVGSLLSAMVTSPNQLIFTRSFMGIGAALIMPATLSLLTNIFTDPKERGRAIGVWAALAGTGSALGPLLGGALLAHFWWGSVFLINVPVTLAALAAGKVLLPTSRDEDAPKLDLLGALLSIVGLVGVLFAIIEAPAKGWSDTAVIGSLVGGLAALVAFTLWELHVEHPMLDVRFFRNRRFSAANGAVTLVFFAMVGTSFLITQYLQIVLGFSPLGAGVRMLPMALVMLLVAPMAPRLVEKVGTKVVVGTGLLIAAVALAYVSRIPAEDGYVHLVTGMSVLSFGIGLTMAPATESIMGSLPPSKAGVGSAMNDTTRQMGAALGVAIIGSVAASAYRPGVGSALSGLGLSPDVLERAKDSIGTAISAAGSLPADQGARVASLARGEFVDALGTALTVSSVILLGAAAVVFAFLPARARDVREDESGPLDGLASLRFAEAEGALETASLEDGHYGAGVSLDPVPRSGLADGAT
jgi:EmrB/QacA subfamily drug resistance transporter